LWDPIVRHTFRSQATEARPADSEGPRGRDRCVQHDERWPEWMTSGPEVSGLVFLELGRADEGEVG
jgi:hypothetical protein